MPGIVWLLAVAAALVGAMAPTPWWQLGIIAGAVAACAAFGRIRSPALRFGVIAALVFVAVRVAYRIVFTSTVAPPVGAVLLIDLPVIPLGGPFRGIALFGPLTLDQLLATIADASRFAAVFVVFGAANAIADARTLLARAPRPFLPLATVLALALGAVPALIASVQRVDRAARMRGEGRGPRLLVPVLEQAVERATTLGASMELRGFPAAGPASAPPSTPPSTPAPTLPSAQTQAPAPAREPCASVLLRAEGLSVQYGGGSDASAGRETVTGANLELRAGELALLTGPTGSGKSTLLRALAGLAPAYTGGRVSGTLEVLGREVLGSGSAGAGPGAGLRPARLSGLVALVPQRVEHSFLAETVRAELAFAPARRGVSGDELADAVDRGLERFGLTGLAERDPATLSAGEATGGARGGLPRAAPGAAARRADRRSRPALGRRRAGRAAIAARRGLRRRHRGAPPRAARRPGGGADPPLRDAGGRAAGDLR
ncbi:MAG: ATP-binding cassette domain-containing protein [Candidatus Leucobacter sulfamidivorax]|nr:ATP-binding cassette domain-containing protein [Candidatus Leucobacter sulfamidivorax]